jgi:hypothetical protein
LYDVGEFSNGKIFTTSEYLNVESKYAEAINLIIEKIDISFLLIIEIEKWKRKLKIENFNSIYNKSFFLIYKKLKNEYRIEKNELDIVIKLILRGNIWGKLIFKDSFFVHFGYDYYMYVGCKKDISDIIKKIELLGLYVEDYKSPYL